MREAPLKTTAYSQGIFAQSPIAKEKLGTLRILEDGRKYRYAKAGGTALACGKATSSPAIVAAHVDATIAAINTTGTQVTLTVTAGTAIAADALANGYLQVSEGLLLGRLFRIDSNTELSAAGTSITCNLSDRITGYDGTTRITLVKNPWSGLVISATPESFCSGVAPIAVTANYYFWVQTGGLSSVLVTGTPAIGSMMTMGAVDGSLGAVNATFDIDQPIVGVMFGTAGVDTKYKPIFLKID